MPSLKFSTQFLCIIDSIDIYQELFRLQRLQLHALRNELRDQHRQIRGLRRELVPLTTGLIMSVKRERTQRLRLLVRRKQVAATKIQVRRLLCLSS
jgi:hypothetical protein